MMTVTDILNSENALYLFGFLTPGIVIVYVRSRFLEGVTRGSTAEVIGFFAISIAYYTLTFPLLNYLTSAPWFNDYTYTVFLGYLFLFPLLIGWLTGVLAKRNFVSRAVEALGGKTVHPVTNAWDFKFGSIKPEWVLVVLKDGTKYVGYFGYSSFAGSQYYSRDLYISQLYYQDKDNQWQAMPGHSLWVSDDEIRTIMFIDADYQKCQECGSYISRS